VTRSDASSQSVQKSIVFSQTIGLERSVGLKLDAQYKTDLAGPIALDGTASKLVKNYLCLGLTLSHLVLAKAGLCRQD
jgi:hypothetical protein